MLTGEATDAMMLDQAVKIARQFGPEIINSVAVMSPQQVMLEVRFVEISRDAGRELGFQRNPLSVTGPSPTSANDTNRLPVPPGVIPAAGVLSGGAPFGFLVHRFIKRRRGHRCDDQRA